MFLEQQISILNHVTLKTGVMMLKIQLSSQEYLYLKQILYTSFL